MGKGNGRSHRKHRSTPPRRADQGDGRLLATQTTRPAQVFSVEYLVQFFNKLQAVLTPEPTLLELTLPAKGTTLTLVGDLHGQLPDLLHMLSLSGQPSPTHLYIFNGDMVNRGCWGLEVLLTIGAWKLALPESVYMLRGNHEAISPSTFYVRNILPQYTMCRRNTASTTSHIVYSTNQQGFKAELAAKVGLDRYKTVFAAFVSMASHLPIAALIQKRTLVCHGGLWRDPKHYASTSKYRPGTIDQLRKASKGGPDPDPTDAHMVASDVVWSDPSGVKGIRANAMRGQGTSFGPDVTEAFMRKHRLVLVVRSHESPNSRDSRREHSVRLPSLVDGYSVDHAPTCGMLITLFSAPAYPMFTDNTNRAAVMKLTGPYYTRPSVLAYDAAPRPTHLEHMYQLPDVAALIDAEGANIDMVEGWGEAKATAAQQDAWEHSTASSAQLGRASISVADDNISEVEGSEYEESPRVDARLPKRGSAESAASTGSTYLAGGGLPRTSLDWGRRYPKGVGSEDIRLPVWQPGSEGGEKDGKCSVM